MIFRAGQPYDIDEAGYLSFALNDYYNLLSGGIYGWWSAVHIPTNQAPLTSALASLVFIFTGRDLLAAFVVPLLSGVGCVIVTYFLGKSVASRPVGLLAAILVAGCPVILNYSRSFHFALPATFAMTGALLALIRSKRFDRIGWVLTFGVCLGLMPLARTMTIAFVPGLVAASLLNVIAEPLHRRKCLLLLLLSLLVATAVAATWFVTNGRYVFEYLVAVGYGTAAAEYGPSHSVFGLDAWLSMLRALINSDVYLLYFIVVLSGAVMVFAVTLREAFKSRPTDFAMRVLNSRELPVIIVIAQALVALTSTRTNGSAFYAPIVPAMLVVASWAFFAISDDRYYRRVLVGLFAAAAVIASVPLVDLRTRLAPLRTAELPILGHVIISDGRGALQRYEDSFHALQATEPIASEASVQWGRANDDAALIITRMCGGSSTMAFGFRHLLLNVNTVNLHELLNIGMAFAGLQVPPAIPGDTIDGYLAWLMRDGKAACALVTSDESTENDIQPAVLRPEMREAAERAGFVPIENLKIPDGQILTFWKRRAAL